MQKLIRRLREWYRLNHYTREELEIRALCGLG